MITSRAIASLDVTPSGSTVAVIDQRGEARVWSGSRELANWRADSSGYQIAWLDDGQHLMTHGTSGLQSWTVAGQHAGHRVVSKRGHEVLGFELSLDRKTIAITMQASRRFVDVADVTDPAMAGVRVPLVGRFSSQVPETRLSANGTSLLIVERYASGGSSAAAIEIRHVATGETTSDVRVGDIYPCAIALSRFEERIAIAEQRHEGHHIAIVRASSGAIERTLSDEGPSAKFVEFSPDGTKLWSSGPDGRGRIWDVETGDRVTVRGARRGVWAPTGDTLFAVEDGGKEVRRVSIAPPPPSPAPPPTVLRRTPAR